MQFIFMNDFTLVFAVSFVFSLFTFLSLKGLTTFFMSIFSFISIFCRICKEEWIYVLACSVDIFSLW